MSNTEKMIKFYNECNKKGYTNFNDEYSLQKAYLVAKNLGLTASESEIKALFENAKKAHQRYRDEEAKRKDKERFANAREQDLELNRNLSKYAKLKGRNKLVAIFTEELKGLRDEYEKLKNLPSDYYRAVSIQEKDWAIHGGIASGIAGSAAGVATAIAIQNENASIRNHNQRVRESSVYLNLATKETLEELSKKISKLENKIEEAKCLFESKETGVLKYLRFDCLNIKRTEGKSIHYTIDCWIKPDSIKMNSNFNLVIDGTLYANLIEKSTKEIVSSVQFVFPENGVPYNSNPINLEGIDVNPKKLNVNFDDLMIEFDTNQSDLIIVESLINFASNNKSKEKDDILELKIKSYYSNNFEELKKLIDERDTLLKLAEKYKQVLNVENTEFYKFFVELEKSLSKPENQKKSKIKALEHRLTDLDRQMKEIVQHYKCAYDRCVSELESNRSRREGHYSILKG